MARNWIYTKSFKVWQNQNIYSACFETNENIVKSHCTSRVELITNIFNEGEEKQLSIKTISRQMHRLGFWERRPSRKPLVSQRNRMKRLAFFHSHRNWGLDEWKNIIFSDESRFKLFCCDGRTKVWRRAKERFLPECTQKTVQGGSGSLLFWGYITYDKIGSLIEIKNKCKFSKLY